MHYHKHFYNGIDAAKIIGISYKTLLRWVEKGKLVPEEDKTPTGQLVIPGEQVERFKREIEQERKLFGQSQPVTDSQSSDVLDSLTEKVQNLEQRVEELERKLTEISSISPSMSETVLRPQKSLYRYEVDRLDAEPTQSPPTTFSDANITIADLPPGTLHSTDFAAQLGLTKPVMEGMLKNGVMGEQLERTRIPATSTGRFSNYFTPDQQRQARVLLRKHGKIK